MPKPADHLPTIYVVRHGQGMHQLEDGEGADIRDPDLTEEGRRQCQEACDNFPFHDKIDMLCASPIRRTIQTCQLCFKPEIERGMKITVLPRAQECSEKPKGTGHEEHELREEFGDILDYSMLTDDWNSNEGLLESELTSSNERARQLRNWLRNRPEKHIVLVSHGGTGLYLTSNIDARGQASGPDWTNTQWRAFGFASKKYPDALLVELDESIERLEKAQRKGKLF